MLTPRRERRARRSPEHSTALRFQLESTLRRAGMSALALTDRTGMLLAWAGDEPTCEELCAAAPVIAQGGPTKTLPGKLGDAELAVRSLDCFGEPLYLASAGGGVAREALLAHSARGIHRILTSN
jgi:hypothetical protein